MEERAYEELKTVGELIEVLKEFDPKTPIKVTWEGTIQTLFKDSLYLSYNNVLMIDADNNDYKEVFQLGKGKE
jgi:hypothetical protein